MPVLGESYVAVLTTLLTQSFVLGIRAAAPLMTALLLSNLVLGLISRTLPQINVIAVGFSVNSLLRVGVSVLVGWRRGVDVSEQRPSTAIDLFCATPFARRRRLAPSATYPVAVELDRNHPMAEMPVKNHLTRHRIAGSRPASRGRSCSVRTWPRRRC